VKYLVEADRTVVVVGLGVFEEGSHEVTDAQVENFARIAGIPLNQGAMPEGVTLTIVAGEEE
jgi:hypothetical protein